MIKILMGPKGMGKSKTLISLVTDAVASEKGSVVCVVKDDRYNYSVPHSVRLINSQEFIINGASELYGFICGIISMNFDVSHIFIDSITTIMSCSISDIDNIIPYLEKISEKFNIDFTVVVSGNVEDANVLTKEYLI